MSFDLSAVWKYFPLLLNAIPVSVVLFLCSQFVGTIAGFGLALMRLAKNPVLRGIGVAYVWVMRGVPPLIVLFFAYYALPSLGLELTALQAGILGLSLTAAAYNAEVIRSGIMAVDSGQWEAAEALAISRGRRMRKIILPQAIRIMIPTYFSNAITLLKSTSLASAITVQEVTGVGNKLISSTFKPFEILLMAAAIYLVLNSIIVLIQLILERRFALKG